MSSTRKRRKCLAPYHLIEMFITLDFPSLCSRLLIPSFDVFCFRLYSNFLAISSKLSGDFRDDSLSFVSQTGEMFYGFRVEFKNVS